MAQANLHSKLNLCALVLSDVSSELLSEKLSLPHFSLLVLNLLQVHVGPDHDF